ncbi:MAG: hypothetical protein LBF51_06445, partial [Zoogloeaceae bacterium]|nr:hypothetical protein [Zoogloeaceae bacterium]
GDDTLDGGAGGDRYLLRSGSGRDVINNYDSATANVDVVCFEDVNFDALRHIDRNGNDLVITYGESDAVTLKNHFSGSAYQVDRFIFADETTLTASELHASAEHINNANALNATGDEDMLLASTDVEVSIVGYSPEICI